MPGPIVKHDQCDPTLFLCVRVCILGPSLQAVEEWRVLKVVLSVLWL